MKRRSFLGVLCGMILTPLAALRGTAPMVKKTARPYLLTGSMDVGGIDVDEMLAVRESERAHLINRGIYIAGEDIAPGSLLFLKPGSPNVCYAVKAGERFIVASEVGGGSPVAAALSFQSHRLRR